MNKVIFDSAKVNALIPTAFGLGTDEPDYDLLAEEALFSDALDRGIVFSTGPISAPSPAPSVIADRPTANDRAEWARMSLESAPAGSYFVANEPRKYQARRGAGGRRPLTHNEVRDAELDAVRPAGQPFDSVEWEAYFATARRFDA